VGANPYLNALPLVDGIPGVRPARPSDLARLLENDEIDLAAALSVGAALRRPDWRVLPSTGVGSDGPVRTVLLLHQVPMAEIRSLHPDPASGTSNLLARWIVRRATGRIPSEVDEGSQARVVIGDAAFGHEPREGTDLGAAWKDATGLPFLFAGWIAGPKLAKDRVRLLEIDAWLLARLALDEGRVERIAAEQTVVPAATAREYLTFNVRHRLDARFREGADRFAAEVLDLGVGTGEIPWAC
jgi:predicted solute-binding protein